MAMELTAHSQMLILECVSANTTRGDFGCYAGLMTRVLSCPVQQLHFINSGINTLVINTAICLETQVFGLLALLMMTVIVFSHAVILFSR